MLVSVGYRWWIIAGIAIATAGGLLVVGGFYCGVRFWMEGRPCRFCALARCLWQGYRDGPVSLPRPVPSGLTGMVERLIFMLLTVVAAHDAPTLMGAWLGLKLAANWHRRTSDADTRRGFLAMLAGLISMMMAWIGGAMIRWGLLHQGP